MSRKNGNGAATKSKRKRPKQTFIPGTAPPSIPAIDEAAQDYREARDARIRMNAREVELAGVLIREMKGHGMESYAFDGYVVNLKHLEKVSVKSSKQDEE